jgi:hypothetical protein
VPISTPLCPVVPLIAPDTPFQPLIASSWPIVPPRTSLVPYLALSAFSLVSLPPFPPLVGPLLLPSAFFSASPSSSRTGWRGHTPGALHPVAAPGGGATPLVPSIQ